jgi:hypothetical protein
MKLIREFIRLPRTFDAARLAAEIDAIDERDWRPHPEGHPGNSALPLIAVGGAPDDDAVRGAMLPTPALARLPYLRQVLATFHTVWGRTRLMRLDGNAEAVAHTDTNYYWSQHTRLHVPIVTDPAVRFLCGDAEVHMAAGEAWIFDTWRRHNVLNPNPTRRIHLVADTVGSAAFWELVDRGLGDAEAQHVPYAPLRNPTLATENVNHPVVMQPAEQAEMIALVAEAMSGAAADAEAQLRHALEVLRRDWRSAWARFGARRDGWPLYRQLLRRAEGEIAPLRGRMRLRNGIDAVDAVQSLVFRPALAEDAGSGSLPARSPRQQRRIERPVFIVCAPRSGSTLFFETLAQSPSLWTVGGESHAVIEGLPALHPASRRYHSNRLTAADATPEVIEELEGRFRRQLRDREGRAPAPQARGLRLLEKTPKNALRVPFLAAAFPDATFVYLYRDIRNTISSMLDAWRSGRFATYPALPGWPEEPRWSMLLTPGWRELAQRSLPEIVAAQWSTTTRYLLDDLEQLAPGRWCIASYEALLDDPQREMLRLSSFLDTTWDRVLASPLPPSRSTLTAPDPEKWKRNEADLAIAMPLIAEVAERARALFAHAPVPIEI